MGAGRTDAAAGDEANVVRLRGRLANPPQLRVLPSGDEIATWRVIVPRAEKDAALRADGRKRASVDTIECAAWRPGVRRRVLGWQPDDVVEVDGALQRRFYRHEGRLVSRHEVVVRGVRRLTRAPGRRRGG